eukprot:SAG22_NODE_15058_length_358_cov_0.799228_1_plen_82_part_01
MVELPTAGDVAHRLAGLDDLSYDSGCPVEPPRAGSQADGRAIAMIAIAKLAPSSKPVLECPRGKHSHPDIGVEADRLAEHDA